MPDNINVKIVTTLDQASIASVRNQVKSELSNIKINSGSTSSSVSGNATKMFTDTGKAATEASKKIKTFSDQVDFTAKRLAAYYIVAGSFFRLSAAIGDAGAAIVDFDKQVNRLTQIFNGNKKAANELTDQIIDFSKAYGQSAREVLKIADTLAQAGDKFGGNARSIAQAAELIAKTNLAATFGDIEETTEGVVAILNQFNLTANDTGRVLDITNGLAKKFAAEAGDLFKAVKAGGGAFALADNSIENFAASVTTLRSITRLTAAQIGTALNTISVRNLREDVIAFTDEITGGRIRNADGSLKNLTQRLIEVAKATKGLTDEQLGPIIEKISDTRQAKFLIPLIRDIQKGSGVSTFLTALDDARKQSGSFSRDVSIGLDRIEVQLGSIGAKFEEVFKAFSQDQGIKDLVKDFANLAKLSADALKYILPLVPALAKIGAAAALMKGFSYLRQQIPTDTSKSNIVNAYFAQQNAAGNAASSIAPSVATTSKASPAVAKVTKAAQKEYQKRVASAVSNAVEAEAIRKASVTAAANKNSSVFDTLNKEMQINFASTNPTYGIGRRVSLPVISSNLFPSTKGGTITGSRFQQFGATTPALTSFSAGGSSIPGINPNLLPSYYYGVRGGFTPFGSSTAKGTSIVEPYTVSTANPFAKYIRPSEFGVAGRSVALNVLNRDFQFQQKVSGDFTSRFPNSNRGQRASLFNAANSAVSSILSGTNINSLKPDDIFALGSPDARIFAEDQLRTRKALFSGGKPIYGLSTETTSPRSTLASTLFGLRNENFINSTNSSFGLKPRDNLGGFNIIQNLNDGQFGPQLNRRISTRITAEDLQNNYNSIKAAVSSRRTDNFLGTGALKATGLLEFKRIDPTIRSNFAGISNINNQLADVGGQKVQLRQKIAKLGQALDAASDAYLKGGKNNLALQTRILKLSDSIDKLNVTQNSLTAEEEKLLSARIELEKSTRNLTLAQIEEARIKGTPGGFNGLTSAPGSPTRPGFFGSIARFGSGAFNTGLELIGKGARDTGNFIKNNPAIALSLATVGGSLALDKLSAGQSANIQTDLFSQISDKNAGLTQQKIEEFAKNNRSAQSGAGFFSGASTGLSLAGGVAAPLAATGIGAPAALAILAGGALIGGISGLVGGRSTSKEQQRKELLNALSQSQDPIQRQIIEANFIRGINKKGGFEGGNTGKNGGFKFTGNPNSYKTENIYGFGTPKATLFQDEYANQLSNTEEGKAVVSSFRDRALKAASSFSSAGPNFAGQLREKLIKEEADNIKKAGLATGKVISDQEALGEASLQVSEKLRAAGLATDDAGTALGQIKDSINDFNKNLDNVGKQLSSGGPSIINFMSGFQQKTADLAVGLQGSQLSRGLGQSALSGIFGQTNSIGTNGIGKFITEQLKSDIANANTASVAGSIATTSLGRFLNPKDTAVFSDIAQIQKGFGNINKDVVGRLAGKTFESSDTVEQNLSRLLPALFKQQGISVTTGEGKDLLNKAKQELTNQLGTPEGRKAFEQDQNGFIAQFLKKFGGDLDVAGGRVEQAFASLQEEIDKSNASFEKFRSIQQSLLQDRQQRFNFNLSRITDAGALGASSSQLRAGITGLINRTGSGILNGSDLRSAGADVIQRQAALTNIQTQLKKNPTDIGLIQKASEAQRNLIDAQDKYNSIINDTNNAMTLLRARIEETSKQFAELRQTANTAGGKNFGEFGRDKFKLEQFTSQFSGFAGRLQQSGIRTADQFAALSPEEKKKLAGNLGSLAGSSQVLGLLDTAREYGGASFKGTNVTLGNTVDIIKQIFGEQQLGGVAGLNNVGTSTSQLGQQRAQDFELLGELQKNQLDVQSNINNSVLNIYRYLVNRGGTLEEKSRLAELDATQQQNSKNTPTASNSGLRPQQQISQAQVGQLVQALDGVNKAITKATGQSTKIDFNGNIKIDGLATAGRDKAIGQVVANILDAFIKQLDRSDPAQALLADKLQAAIKTIVVK